MKYLFTSLFVFALYLNVQSQCNPTTEKMMVIGDSWAFFSWTGNSYNENLDRFGFSDVECYSTANLAVNGAEANDYFTNPARVQELEDYITSNSDLEYVHYSLGGNDAMGTWHKDMDSGEESAILDTIMLDVRAGIDTILSFNPDLKILISGYDFANFSETIETLPLALQSLHPFYSTWDGMGQPSITELNEVLNTFCSRFADSAAVWENVYFVNNIGLMQYEYGQTTALQVSPFGTYAQYTAPVPGGIADYPTPLEALNFGGNDSFHLNDNAFELFIKRHFSEWYWNQLRDYHASVSADIANSSSLTATIQTGSSLKLGNYGADDSDILLSFNTSSFDDAFTIDRASLFVEVLSTSGADLAGTDVTVQIASGYFGATISAESDDYADTGDESDDLCSYGTLSEDGHWMRIDLPASFFSHIDMSGSTQFKLSFSLVDTDQYIEFKNISDNAFLDVHYTIDPFSSTPEETDTDLILFPNPANNLINIQAESEIERIEILDINGKVVMQKSGNNTKIDITNLSAGIYVMNIHQQDGIMQKKLIKK